MKKQSKRIAKDQIRHPYLMEILKSYKKGFKAVVIFSFSINILMLSVPIYLLQIYDKIIPNHSSDTLYFLSSAIIVALITLAILELLRNKILAKLGVWFNQKLGHHLLGSSIATAAGSPSNASINGLKDLAKLRDFTTSSAVISLLDLPWVPLYIGILFFIHPVIGTLVLVGALVLFGIAITNELSSRPKIATSDESASQSLDTASSYVKNADVITAMGMRKQLTQRWQEQQSESLALKYGTDKTRAKTTSLVKLIRLLLQVTVIGTAAALILKGELSSGATIATILLMRNAISPLEQSISAWRSVIKARNALGKINAHLKYSPTLVTDKVIPFSQGVLSIDNLRYRYPNAKHSLFYGVDFTIRPGQAVALVGPSASGKSTLSKLLIGISKPSSGSVRLGGHDIALCDSEVLGKRIGYLPQSVELFAGTVRENIARMQKGEQSQVIEAAKLVGIHETILGFPDGYDTDIGEDGAYLSGGQRQRLGLARAVYNTPWLVVLDEPDAHLDVEGKVALIMAINKLKAANAIVVIITHHSNIHRFMDKIYDLRKKRFTSDRSRAKQKKIRTDHQYDSNVVRIASAKHS